MVVVVVGQGQSVRIAKCSVATIAGSLASLVCRRACRDSATPTRTHSTWKERSRGFARRAGSAHEWSLGARCLREGAIQAAARARDRVQLTPALPDSA